MHAEAITIETEKPVTPEAAREVLRNAPGVKVVDDVANKLYPLPLTATGQDDCEVGRIRQNLALVLGLQGKFKEADAIARQELDPAQAETNVAYLKSMLSQTNTWKEARKQG